MAAWDGVPYFWQLAVELLLDKLEKVQRRADACAHGVSKLRRCHHALRLVAAVGGWKSEVRVRRCDGVGGCCLKVCCVLCFVNVRERVCEGVCCVVGMCVLCECVCDCVRLDVRLSRLDFNSKHHALWETSQRQRGRRLRAVSFIACAFPCG